MNLSSRRYSWAMALGMTIANAWAAQPLPVETFVPESSSCRVLRAEVELPLEGYWRAGDALPRGVRAAYLAPTEKGQDLLRMRYEGGPGSGPLPSSMPYAVLVLVEAGVVRPFELSLRNQQTEAEQRISLDPARTSLGSEGIWTEFQEARAVAWLPYVESSASPVLEAWMGSDHADFLGWTSSPDLREGGERLTMFSILGGRAAVAETLQLQSLTAVDGGVGLPVPVVDIAGVEVTSHPYETMLAGRPGGRLPLAELVPRDRGMLYLSQPDALLPLLENGASFLSECGSTWSGHPVTYDLPDRYLQRLGLDQPWLQQVLAMGAVEACAIFFPDLFLIDGTDLTVVCRTQAPQMPAPMLARAGVKAWDAEDTATVTTASGHKVHWARRGSLLLISTSRSELGTALALSEGQGVGSLGQSPEFRYMLTQLPVQSSTRLLLYFSDPFVRRLVSPTIKIGQYRRLQARSEMERLTAAALLARRDGRRAHSVDALVKWGYLPDGSIPPSCTLADDLVSHSATYGTLADMPTLLEVPVVDASAGEAAAYRSYVTEYSSYWRDFFDPISIRLDEGPDGRLDLTTFILPLVDNTIYQGLRDALGSGDDPSPLRVPDVVPPPQLLLSVNLAGDWWDEMMVGLAEAAPFVDPQALADLGPGIHLAVHDADPVVVLGSGDLLAAFGADLPAMAGAEMLVAPFAASLFTRPCTLFVESQDPDRTRRLVMQALAQASAEMGAEEAGVDIDYYRVEGQDAWVGTLSVAGFFKLRWGMEVKDQFLVVRNIPWNRAGDAQGATPSRLQAASLRIWPGACEQGLAGLFAANGERSREAAMNALGYLYPLLDTMSSNATDASTEHRRLFGFRPVHPPGGDWEVTDGAVRSTLYGTPFRQSQPAHPPGHRDFGILRAIEDAALSMQFEDSGLRAILSWTPRK